MGRGLGVGAGVGAGVGVDLLPARRLRCLVVDLRRRLRRRRLDERRLRRRLLLRRRDLDLRRRRLDFCDVIKLATAGGAELEERCVRSVATLL